MMRIKNPMGTLALETVRSKDRRMAQVKGSLARELLERRILPDLC